MKFTIGSDPELFLVNKDGSHISSIGKIGGTKENPLPVPELGKGFAVQEDNVALEFNIPPANTADEFADNIGKMLAHLEVRVAAIGLKLSILPAVRFNANQLRDPACQTFGCDADFNAWTTKQNPKPECPDKLLRSCGGHVHVGTDLPVRMCVKANDLFLGVPALQLDGDYLRRKLYGKAGAYRDTAFGYEYRVLSNFWIATPALCKWVYTRVNESLEFVRAAVDMGIDEDDFLEDDRESIEKAINDSNFVALRYLHSKYQILDGVEKHNAIGRRV